MQQGQGEDWGVHTGAGSSAVIRDQSQLGDPHNGRRMTRVGGADGRVLGGVVSRSLAEGFPGGAVVENLPANAGDMGSSPGLGRSHVPRSS